MAWQGAIGIATFVAIAWALSDDRKAIPWRLVASALVLQAALAVLLLTVPPIRAVFLAANAVVEALQAATRAGTSFVFGYLGGGAVPFVTGADPGQAGATFILAFQALPLILLVSALSALLFHWRVLPLIVRGFAAALHEGSGTIVNVTSIAGHLIHPFAGSAYSTSKAALSGLTREMAGEFAALGVRVNAVAPGEIATEMIGPDYEALVPRIPLDRMGRPEDVAGTIHYLCGDDATYVTGTEVWVTGGQHLL